MKLLKDIFRGLTVMVLILCISVPGMVSAHVTIPDGSTTSCGALDSTDLRVHATNQIDQRLALSSSTNALPMYTSRDFGVSSSTAWVPNSNSWTKKGTTTLDFTGVAGYNISAGPVLNPNRLATLISPRHFLSAGHYTPNVGEVLGFIDANGNRIERSVSAVQNITGTDIDVGLLNADLPDSITYYPLMASSTFHSLLQLTDTGDINVPIVVFDQEGKAIVQYLKYAGINSEMTHSSSTTGIRAAFSEDIVSGDSGNPGFILIDDKPVLLFEHHSVSTGPDYGQYIAQINAIMTTEGGGYQVTQYNNACFTPQVFNHAPTFVGNQGFFTQTTGVDPARSVFTVNASDADVGQSLTFAITSLNGSANPSTPLDPSSYFSINASTGEMHQLRDLPKSTLGDYLNFKVSVTDNAVNVGSSTGDYVVYLRDPIQQSGKMILDPNFAIPNIGPVSLVSRLVLNSDNSMLLGGSFSTINGIDQKVLAKVDASGTLDANFSTQMGTGFSNVSLSPSTTDMKLLATNPLGKTMTFISNSTPVSFNGTATGELLRLNSDGSLDTGFAAAISPGLSTGNVLTALDIDGKTLLTGIINLNGAGIRRMVLLNADGTVDAAFASNYGDLGVLGPTTSVRDGNNIYVGGAFFRYVRLDTTTVNVGRIARFNIDGTFDEAFNASIGTGFNTTVNDIKMRPDGKIVVVGSFSSFNGSSTPGVALLNADGTLDAAFAANMGTGFSSPPNKTIVQSDNKMLIAGNYAAFNGTTVGGLVRLNADGTLDTEFQKALGNGVDATITDMAVRSDGALILTGYFTDYNYVNLYNAPVVLITETPDAPTVPDLLDSYDTGASASDNVTTSTTQVFMGVGSSTATVSLYANNALVATSTVNSSGVWFATTTLPIGTYTVTASQTLSFTTTATSNLSTALSLSVIDESSISSGSGVTYSSGGGGGGGSSAYNPTAIVQTNAVVNASSTASSANAATINMPSNGDAFVNSPQASVPLTNLSKLINKNISKGLPSYSKLQSLLGATEVSVSKNHQIQINSVSLVSNQSLGSRGEEIRQLQKFLNTLGYSVSMTGPGSIGQESSYFGTKTRHALAAFQKANGIVPAQGYFGPLTRAKILSLLK